MRAVIKHFRKERTTCGRRARQRHTKTSRIHATRSSAARGAQRCGQQRRHFAGVWTTSRRPRGPCPFCCLGHRLLRTDFVHGGNTVAAYTSSTSLYTYHQHSTRHIHGSGFLRILDLTGNLLAPEETVPGCLQLVEIQCKCANLPKSHCQGHSGHQRSSVSPALPWRPRLPNSTDRASQRCTRSGPALATAGGIKYPTNARVFFHREVSKPTQRVDRKLVVQCNQSDRSGVAFVSTRDRMLFVVASERI